MTVRLIIPPDDSKAVVAIEELAFVTMLDSDTYISEDPLRAVARGTGIALENVHKFPFLIK